MGMSDLYSILGVNRNSSQEEIKAAYRKLAARHHPDRGGDTKRFQEIQHAYDVLSDPQKRSEYDRPHNPFSGAGGFSFQSTHFDLNDIFSQMFGGMTGARQAMVYRTTIGVTIEQVYHGGEQTMHIQINGVQHVVKIEIPKGISDGAQIRYDKLIPGAQLIVEFRIQRHHTWERRNQDLIMNHDISVLDLITGTKFNVNTISGSEIQVTVDPRTHPVANLKVAGHGLPIPGTTQYGDLFITLRPYMPDVIPETVIRAIEASKIA